MDDRQTLLNQYIQNTSEIISITSKEHTAIDELEETVNSDCDVMRKDVYDKLVMCVEICQSKLSLYHKQLKVIELLKKFYDEDSKMFSKLETDRNNIESSISITTDIIEEQLEYVYDIKFKLDI